MINAKFPVKLMKQGVWSQLELIENGPRERIRVWTGLFLILI